MSPLQGLPTSLRVRVNVLTVASKAPSTLAPATSPAVPLSRQARPISGPGTCCSLCLELSPQIPLKLDLTPPSGLCPVRLLPSTILFRFTSLPTYSLICLSIYCCSLSCPRMNTQLGQELCFAPWCILRTQTQSWHVSGIQSTFVEGINGPSWGGSSLSNRRALICRLSAMSKLILQNTGAGDCSPQQTRGLPALCYLRICRAGLPDPHLETFCPLFHGNSLFFGS